jgi:putative membrane protein
MFLAGVAGASAMILPGISGGYLLLLLGAYVPLLAAIQRFVGAVGARDLATLLDVGLGVLVPVALGVVVGIAGVANLLRWLLRRHDKVTYGVLLGLLFGAVLGLWPFQQGVSPAPGTVLKGQVVTLDPHGLPVFERTGDPVEEDDWPTVYFRPAAGQVAGALALVAVSCLATGLLDRLGRQDR